MFIAQVAGKSYFAPEERNVSAPSQVFRSSGALTHSIGAWFYEHLVPPGPKTVWRENLRHTELTTSTYQSHTLHRILQSRAGDTLCAITTLLEHAIQILITDALDSLLNWFQKLDSNIR